MCILLKTVTFQGSVALMACLLPGGPS
jgi:hypothetical protein